MLAKSRGGPWAIVAALMMSAMMLVCVVAFSAPNPQRPPAESASASAPSSSSRPPPLPLPATDDPHAILGLDRHLLPRPPAENFAVIHRAYRDLARKYHPDVAAGPDATPEDRARASDDFARISGAYEELRSRKDEEEFEVVIMGGNFDAGKRDRRVKYRTSEKIRESETDRIDYDRIVENSDRRNLKARSWRDPGEYDYEQGGRHNGDFGPVRRW